MDFGKDLNDAKYMFLGNEMSAKEKLHIHICNYMKKQGFHEVAEIFAKEANIEIAKLGQDESLLTDWWGAFWTLFCSSSTKQPGGYPESSAQPPATEVLEILSQAKRTNVGIFQAPITGKSPQHVNNVAGQPPEGWFQTLPEDSQRRAGKRPMNTETSLGYSDSRKKGKAPVGFPPVQLLPTEMIPMLHPNSSSHLLMLGTIQPPPPIVQIIQPPPQVVQPPPQVVGAFWPVKLEPTYPAGQNWGYLPAATFSSEDYLEYQRSLARVRVRAPDGSDPDSCMARVPAAFLDFMQQTAEARKRHSNTPRAKF